MTVLKNRDWLFSAHVQKAFDVLEQDEDRARAVGGTVRNSLLGEPVDDVDIACTAVPQVVLQRAEAAGVKAVPTGVDHGTVTLVIDHHPIEVTTLREDVETHGRHATVSFGTDWAQDARRRDFTMNALYVDRTGELFDPLGGLEDCLSRTVRFIGDPHARIREDYLRILRFFRFFASYGQGEIDAQGYAACLELKSGLALLSLERVTKELLRTLTARRVLDALSAMEAGGILNSLLGQEASSQPLALLLTLKDAPEAAASPLVRLAGVGGAHVASCLRLSKQQQKQISTAHLVYEELERDGVEQAVLKRLLVAHGPDAVVEGLLLLWMYRGLEVEEALHSCLRFTHDWAIPEFPLSGKLLVSHGILAGPQMGAAISKARQIWAEKDYQISAEQLIAELKEAMSKDT